MRDELHARSQPAERIAKFSHFASLREHMPIRHSSGCHAKKFVIKTKEGEAHERVILTPSDGSSEAVESGRGEAVQGYFARSVERHQVFEPLLRAVIDGLGGRLGGPSDIHRNIGRGRIGTWRTLIFRTSSQLISVKEYESSPSLFAKTAYSRHERLSQ